MHRLAAICLLLVLTTASCTSGSVPTTTPAEPSPSVLSTTTTVVSSSTTTTPTAANLEPDLPDPVDVAEQGWGEIEGFVQVDLEESALNGVEFRLNTFLGNAVEGLSYTGLEPEDGGTGIVALSMSPAPFLRGDPLLAPGLAGSLAGPFDDLEEVTVAAAQVYRIFLGEEWWYFWASNTHLYAAIGPDTEAERAISAIIDGAPDTYLWQADDCLWFGTYEDTSMPYAPFGTANVVPCNGPHTHEVILSDGTSYGPDDGFPGSALSIEVERTCGIAFRDYIGIDWVDSKVSAIRYLPDSSEWDEGDRYLACVAELPAPGGGALPIDGTLRGIGGDALILREPGDCHLGTLNAEPVDCRLTHTGEFIGYLDDPTDLGPEYPGGTELFDAALPACELLVDEYAEVREHSGARVRAHVVPPSVVEWEDGLRAFRCYAFAIDNGGRRLEISGSFAEAWEIVRFSEDDVTAEFPGSRL